MSGLVNVNTAPVIENKASATFGLINVGGISLVINFPSWTKKADKAAQMQDSPASDMVTNDLEEKNDNAFGAQSKLQGRNLNAPLPKKRISGVDRTLIFPRRDGSYFVQRRVASDSFVLNRESSQPLSFNDIAEGDLSVEIPSLRGTTLSFRKAHISAKDVAAYSSSDVHLLLDIKRIERDSEYFILVSPTTTLFGKIDSELEIKCDDGSKYYLSWPPHKLGDGSYGTVYEVRGNQKTYAAKFFYERQFSSRTGLMSFGISDFQRITKTSSIQTQTGGRTLTMHFSQFIDGIFNGIQERAVSEKKSLTSVLSATKSAVKRALSKSEELTNLSKQKFDAERMVTADINTAIYNARGDSDEDATRKIIPSKYVEVIASCSDFREQPAFAALAEFNSLGRSQHIENISNYMIVMELCSLTLKDILEQRWVFKLGQSGPATLRRGSTLDAGLANSRVQHTTESTEVLDHPAVSAPYSLTLHGYDLLRELNFDDRAQAVLPIVIDLAYGLHTLHAADKLHHDLKPGNIFLKIGPAAVEALLGDFSFVAQAADKGSTEAILRDVVNTGTQHFRAPEQRDFSETYQAQVIHEFGLNRKFALLVSDPKFEPSSASSQDRVVFSHDPTGLLYRIDYAERVDDTGVNAIYLDALDSHLRGLFVESEETTQITIYKLPTIRSDIFGFGAVFYDLISAGRSAERFYEVVRPIDFPGSTVTVDSIIALYNEFCSNQSLAGGKEVYRAIFERFMKDNRNGVKDFCRPEIVEIIMRCITQHLRDCYSSELDRSALSSTQTPLPVIITALNLARALLPFVPFDNNHVLLRPTNSVQWPFLEPKLSEMWRRKADRHSIGSGKQEHAGIGAIATETGGRTPQAPTEGRKKG